jgi:hypothetical protein
MSQPGAGSSPRRAPPPGTTITAAGTTTTGVGWPVLGGRDTTPSIWADGVYAINSSLSVGTSSAQYAWLKNDLTARSRRCVVAYWHHPRWSSGSHGSQSFMDPIWDLLYDRGADVLVAGHDHSYKRFAPLNKDGKIDWARGVQEFVVGTGGRSLYSFKTVVSGSKVRNNTTYGVLKLDLSSSGYAWRFLPAVGSFTDSGSRSCH